MPTCRARLRCVCARTVCMLVENYEGPLIFEWDHLVSGNSVLVHVPRYRTSSTQKCHRSESSEHGIITIDLKIIIVTKDDLYHWHFRHGAWSDWLQLPGMLVRLHWILRQYLHLYLHVYDYASDVAPSYSGSRGRFLGTYPKYHPAPIFRWPDMYTHTWCARTLDLVCTWSSRRLWIQPQAPRSSRRQWI